MWKWKARKGYTSGRFAQLYWYWGYRVESDNVDILVEGPVAVTHILYTIIHISLYCFI